MTTALRNPDPYYWIRDVQNADTQRMALGQRGGYSPAEITNMVGTNFDAQQQNEITQKKLQMAQKELTLRGDALDMERNNNSSNKTMAIWSGVGQLVGSLLGNYGGRGKPGVGVASPATTAPTDASASGSSWYNGLFGNKDVPAYNADDWGGDKAAYDQSVSDAGGSGTVICTELNRQGLLPDDIYALDAEYATKHIDREAYEGYRLWADPVVRLMRQSALFTGMIRPFCLAWAYEMAHMMNPAIKGNHLGKLLFKVGVPVCRIIYRIAVAKKEVCHG